MIYIFTSNHFKLKNIFSFVLIMFSCINIFAQSNPTLTALYERDKNVIKLRWQHTDKTVSSYSVQRSSDNSVYKDIYAPGISNFISGDFLKFTDEKISTGKNYYRLKINRIGSSSVITPPVMVIQGNTENKWVMYPVPVGSLLNLQFLGSGALRGVITVVIQSVSSGTVFTRLRLASTTRTIQIPVNNIGRGIYDIRLYVDNEVVWKQRFSK